ncbi:MAG: hypothetical protein OEV92_01755 [Nitrospinota bacterium]|nr:hypothetical protein [Nitrospinota bacterium]
MALYNNLNRNEDLALKIDETVRSIRPDGWRGIKAKENVIKGGILSILNSDPTEVERIFQILSAQREY